MSSDLSGVEGIRNRVWVRYLLVFQGIQVFDRSIEESLVDRSRAVYPLDDDEFVVTPDPEWFSWPKNAIAFAFMHQPLDPEKGFASQAACQVGPLWFHPESWVESVEQALQRPRVSERIRQQMHSEAWTEVLWCRGGLRPLRYDPELHVVVQRPKTAGILGASGTLEA